LSGTFDYRTFVSNNAFLDRYNEYQTKYAAQVRESDKLMIALVRDALRTRKADRPTRVLDVGCSTGNFLLHLRRAFPDLELVGGELAESSLEICRRNPDLAGISFERLDLLDLPRTRRFDIVVINAVLYMMTDEQFQKALASLAGALASAGALLVFDLFHSFPQRISIIEISDLHPKGMALNFRPIPLVTTWLQQHGFDQIEFRPFTLPIDLPRDDDDVGLSTYTVSAADGSRLAFRGTLFQPWCHLRALRCSF
jgi:SAM-dependent methyltransferase